MTEAVSLARLGIWDEHIPRLETAGWVVGGAAVAAAVPLLEQLRRGPDPGGGLDRLTALLATHPSLAADALESPELGRSLATICGASTAMTMTVRAEPSWLRAAVGASNGLDDAGTETGIRRMVRKEMLRIAVHDLLGNIDMPQVGRRLADLADAAADAALRIAAGEDGPPFAVIAMGKWGGRELNYASDIDVLFVYDVPADGNAEAAARRARAVAEKFISLLGKTTAAGMAFRVDADLRPEGKAGPLARSLPAFAAYYDRWAETWEFQSLIKARPAAGHRALGAAFMELIEPYVYPETLAADAVRSVRANKRRSEELTEAKGATEIKRGVGGIRDVEFAVQLLQLVHGRFDETLRSPTTLEVLEALGSGGYVDRDDAATLASSYRWLRDVEHRIQLVDMRQTHVLPDDPARRERIAKAMGHRDETGITALEAFDAEVIRHRAAVRTNHERLFYRPLLEAFAASSARAPSPERTERQAAALGFRDVAGARKAVEDLTNGLSRRSRLMQQLLPLMLDWLSASPNPDLGLLQLRALVRGAHDNDALVAALRDNPVAAERLCRLLGTSRLLGQFIDRIPESLAFLARDEQLAALPEAAAMRGEARAAVLGRPDTAAALRSLRLFLRRSRLHLAMRDLLGFSDVAAVGRELSHLADAAGDVALELVRGEVEQLPEFASLPATPMSVIAVGKWGGRELNYASDLDVLFVYRATAGADKEAVRAMALKVAERWMTVLSDVTPVGAAFKVDADIRPEGRDGPLARSLHSYERYYERWAQTWEHQALLKARAAAGDPELGAEFEALAASHAYPAPASASALRDIRTVKARVEKERIPPDEDPAFHMKLGPGGLADVEFTVQLLQHQHGAADPSLRTTGTLDALAALGAAGHLDADEVARLDEAYRFCGRTRNRLFLQAGRPRDSLPSDSEEAARLAVSLGFEIHPTSDLREHYRRLTRRARRVVERRFYRTG